MSQSFICGECDLPNKSGYHLPGDTALCAACKAMPGWFRHPAVCARLDAERRARGGDAVPRLATGTRVCVKFWDWHLGESEITGVVLRLTPNEAVVRLDADRIASVPAVNCRPVEVLACS